MTRKLIILPFILFFVSCTVTKRVHRPGYHIQWRKIERSNSSEKSKPIIADNQSVEKDALVLEPRKVEPINDLLFESERIPIAQFSDDEAILSSQHSDGTVIQQREAISRPATANVTESKNTQVQSNRKKSAPPIFWRTPPQNLRKLGIAFMIVGSLLLFGSLLVYLGAFSGSGGPSWIAFFVELVEISEFFWIFVFILLIILVAYISYLIVLHILGGPLAGVIVGLSFLILGILFYELGKRRTPEPPNP